MPYTFELASAIAQDALEGQFDAVHLVYNEYVSAIAYTPSIKARLLTIYVPFYVCIYVLPFLSTVYVQTTLCMEIKVQEAGRKRIVHLQYLLYVQYLLYIYVPVE